MKITTSQQVVAVSACCPCELPQCAAPRKECESRIADAEAVGFTFGGFQTFYGIAGPLDISALPCPDKVTVFRRVEASQVSSHPDAIEPFGFVVTVDPDAAYNGIGYPVPSVETGDPPYSPYVDTYAGAGVFTGIQTGVFLGGAYDGETWTVTSTLAFSDPVTTTDLQAAIATLIDAADWAGSSCASTLASFVASCGGSPTDITVLVSGTQARYRFAPPSGFSTPEVPRSVWEMQWDEVTATEDWWIWYDTGMPGAEPSPGPSLVAERDWTWGGDMDSPWSDWYVIDLPEAGSSTRVVNVMVICYHASRIGVKPTAHGDRVAIEDP